MRLAFLQRVNGGFADVPGRVEIRLADPQRNHVVHLRHNFKKVANAGPGQVDNVPGDESGGVHGMNFKFEISNLKSDQGVTFSRLFSSDFTSRRKPCSL